MKALSHIAFLAVGILASIVAAILLALNVSKLGYGLASSFIQSTNPWAFQIISFYELQQLDGFFGLENSLFLDSFSFFFAGIFLIFCAAYRKVQREKYVITFCATGISLLLIGFLPFDLISTYVRLPQPHPITLTEFIENTQDDLRQCEFLELYTGSISDVQLITGNDRKAYFREKYTSVGASDDMLNPNHDLLFLVKGDKKSLHVTIRKNCILNEEFNTPECVITSWPTQQLVSQKGENTHFRQNVPCVLRHHYPPLTERYTHNLFPEDPEKAHSIFISAIINWHKRNIASIVEKECKEEINLHLSEEQRRLGRSYRSEDDELYIVEYAAYNADSTKLEIPLTCDTDGNCEIVGNITLLENELSCYANTSVSL